MTAHISDDDFLDNVIRPELESALYAALLKSGPIKYDAAGRRKLTEAAEKVCAAISPEDMVELQRRADEAIKKMFDK